MKKDEDEEEGQSSRCAERRGQSFCQSRTESGMRLVGSESSHAGILAGSVAASEATGRRAEGGHTK